MRRCKRVLLATAVVLLAGCGERAQSMDASARKTDAQPWSKSDAAEPAFAASDWKGGDQAAWEAQIRKRAQAQNDYTR